MLLRPPVSHRTATRVPFPTPFRSAIRRSAAVWHPSTSAVPPEDARHRSATMARRIYLPIAANDAMAWHARQAGAHRDPAAKGSQMYVTGNDDWSRLQSLLPLSVRDRNVVFDFPPIPRNAAGQNLHTVFTNPTWRFISTNGHTLVGYRFRICGAQDRKNTLLNSST